MNTLESNLVLSSKIKMHSPCYPAISLLGKSRETNTCEKAISLGIFIITWFLRARNVSHQPEDWLNSLIGTYNGILWNAVEKEMNRLF